MSTAILKLSENGGLQRIHDKWLTRSACNSEGAKQDVDRLPLKSFWGLFLLCGSACFLALLLYLIKMVREYMRHSDGSSSKKSIFSFVKEKEEPWWEAGRQRQWRDGPWTLSWWKGARVGMSSVNTDLKRDHAPACPTPRRLSQSARFLRTWLHTAQS